MKDLLKNLITAAPTLENGEYNAAAVLLNYFQQHGIPVQIDLWDHNRANVIASIGQQKPDIPALVIGAHIDVVPANSQQWTTEPFKPVEKDGKIYGRGAADMLGGLCAAADAMRQIFCEKKDLKGRVILAATAGEETDSCGVKRFVETVRQNISNVIGILITEPTDLKIMRAHRGILWVKIETFGKTAHGSMPHLGINAIRKMNELLNHIEKWAIPHIPHPLLGGCSVSPNRIMGGSATNIIPDKCTLELDIRTLPNQEHQDIVKLIESMLDQVKAVDPDFEASVSILRTCPSMETPEDNPFIQTVCRASGTAKTYAAGFTTDGPLFAQLSKSIVILGPGDSTLCHKPNEYIGINELKKAKELYQKIICNLFI